MMDKFYMTITKWLIIVALLIQAIINATEHWQSRKKCHRATRDCQQQERLAIIEEEFQREDNFKAWYAQRMDASHIILPEVQVRRLYKTYLSNEKTIKSRVASEVAE